ncbi:MAG: fibronectin type III domain-containing protein [Candidatus Thorarchaeota archaeon]
MIPEIVFSADITLYWNAVPNADGYRIYKSIDGGQTWNSGITVGPYTSCFYFNVEEDITVLFRVSAYNEAGESVRNESGAWYNHSWLSVTSTTTTVSVTSTTVTTTTTVLPTTTTTSALTTTTTTTALQFIEVDSNNRMTVVGDAVTFSGVSRNEGDSNCYVYGTGYGFNGNFTIDFELEYSSSSGLGVVYPLMLSNNIGTRKNHDTNDWDQISIFTYHRDNNRMQFQIHDYTSGSYATSSYIDINDGTWENTRYYLSLERNEAIGCCGQLELSVFTDTSRTVHVPGSPVTVSIQGSTKDFTNMYLINTHDSNRGDTVSGELSNYEIR